MYFQFQVSGWINTQYVYVKADSRELAYQEAVHVAAHVAAGDSNLYGFSEIEGKDLEDAIANNFGGCLHTPWVAA